jgi:hypothetical protein
MPRRKSSDSIVSILRSAEHLRDKINSLPDEQQVAVRFLVSVTVEKERKKRKPRVKPPKGPIYV